MHMHICMHIPNIIMVLFLLIVLLPSLFIECIIT